MQSFTEIWSDTYFLILRQAIYSNNIQIIILYYLFRQNACMDVNVKINYSLMYERGKFGLFC